jgi:hypothetical protein
MTALGIVFSWVAFTVIAFMALSAVALAKTHSDLEGDLRPLGDAEPHEGLGAGAFGVVSALDATPTERRSPVAPATGRGLFGARRGRGASRARATRARDSFARRLPAARQTPFSAARPTPFTEWRPGVRVSMYGSRGYAHPSTAYQGSSFVRPLASPHPATVYAGAGFGAGASTRMS